MNVRPMLNPRAEELASAIACAVDEFEKTHPGVTVFETLAALEDVRHALTEAWLRATDNERPAA